ncbi:WD40 domain-containing protein, partial [Oryctes borbonicus]
MSKTKNFEIILGTYEEFLVGYRFISKNDSEPVELTLSFASHSHNNSVRCLTHYNHYLASGGADDRIIIYDLKSRKEHSMLTHHIGTVNCLQFTEDHTHLLSGGSDGILAITRVGNWQLEKFWEKAHKGAPIIDIAVHSSSKLALTLGGDCTLRTWNLIKGRQAYVINLNSKSKDPRSLHTVKWAPDGVKFVLCGGLHTDVWSIETGGIVKAIEHKNKVSCCLFYNDETLLIGFENGTLSMFNYNTGTSKEINAHTNRLKSLDMCKRYLVTCASNGEVKIWNKELEHISTCNSGCRNTCVTVVIPKWVKKEEEDDDGVQESIHIDDNSIEVNKEKKSQLDESVVVIENETSKKKKRKSKSTEPLKEAVIEKTIR